MSKVTRLPPFSKTVHVQADIPVSQRDEFDRAIVDIIAGERPRMDALDRDLEASTRRAMAVLRTIEKAVNEYPTTGQARRLVLFLAGLYNGQDYPFDLTELRGIDTEFANAKEVHRHLANGAADLNRWLEDYRIEPVRRP